MGTSRDRRSAEQQDFCIGLKIRLLRNSGIQHRPKLPCAVPLHHTLRPPSPRHPWLADDFDAVYRSHQQRARERLQKRRRRVGSAAAQARLAKLAPDLRATIELAMARARERRAGSRERLLAGFRWPGDHLNGRRLAPFVERRLRSLLHPMLRLFVAGTPRAQTGLRAGRSKERLRAFSAASSSCSTTPMSASTA